MDTEDKDLDMNEDMDNVSESLDDDNSHDIVIPDFSKWTVKSMYDYTNIDYEDLEELSNGITKARRSLFDLTEKIILCERKEKAAKTMYEREYRRSFLDAKGKTEHEKKERASLVCELLENDWLKYNELKNELVRASNTMRIELQTLQAIGNNIRQQMRVE